MSETTVFRESTGEPLHLDPGEELGAGGQARVIAVSAEWAAKVYHRPTEAQEAKLRVMLAHPPADRAALVWPEDLLRDKGGGMAGILLPRITGRRRVFELYNPASRRAVSPLFHYGLLHRAAVNVAEAFASVHVAGYVVGDVNESNVLVDPDGRVVLLDTDSFQVAEPGTGTVHRCPVGRPEFTAPELLRAGSLADVDRTPEHDRFGLGVLLFHLLMEGTHPFAVRHEGAGDPPPVQERIARGWFPYLHGSPVAPPRSAPPIALLNPLLRDLFRRCFGLGHGEPGARPTAEEWVRVLRAAEGALTTCAVSPQHRYGMHLRQCPWCQRARRLRGRDPFPTETAVGRGEHLRPALVPRRAQRKPRAPAAAPARRGLAPASPGIGPLFAGALWIAVLLAGIGAVSQAAGLLLPALAALLFGGVGTIRRNARAGLPVLVSALLVLVLAAVTMAPDGDPATPGAIAGAEAPPTSPSRATYDAGAVTTRPVPLDPESLVRDVGAILGAGGLATGGEPRLSTLEFVVGRDGRVDPATVTLGPGPDSALVPALREVLARTTFRPGRRSSGPVRVHVEVPVMWSARKAALLVEAATWNGPGLWPESPGARGSRQPVDPGLTEEKPDILNREEVARHLQARYPALLRDAGVEGAVQVSFVLDERGVPDPGTIVVVSAPRTTNSRTPRSRWSK